MAAKVAVVAAMVGGLGWLVKVALIWGNGGTNTDEGLVAVMYFVGFLGLVVASAAAGAALTRTRPVWLRVLTGAAGVVAFFIAMSILDAVLSPLAEEGTWQREEVEIVATALIAVAAAGAVIIRSRRISEREPAQPV